MFLQVELDANSRRYHRFLWYDRPGHIAAFEMQRHPFGNPGSPGVATFHVRRTAEELHDLYPEAAESIENSTLMDDLIDSFLHPEQVAKALHGAVAILNEAGMTAHKMFSNDPLVLRQVEPSDRAITQEFDWSELSPESSTLSKVLGLVYLSTKDAFTFRFSREDIKSWTKRGVAKKFPTVFDPLGFISPHILEARRILQSCFVSQIEWDVPLPLTLEKRWNKWLRHSEDLANIRIERHTGNEKDIEHEAFVFFLDASERHLGKGR